MTLPLSFRCAVAVAVLAGAICSPARGGVIAVGDEHSDPVFTGPDVTFATAGRNAYRIATFGGGLGERWARTLPAPRGSTGDGGGIRLAGAGQNRVLVHTVAELAGSLSTRHQDSLVLAPARRSGATLAGCPDRLAVDPEAFSADEDRSVYAVRSCDPEERQRLVIRRHDTGAESQLPVDPRHRVSNVRIAGRYIAFTDHSPAENSTSLRVVDTSTGVETVAVTEAGNALGQFALHDDGLVAVCRDSQIVEFPLAGGTRTPPDGECEGPLVAGDVGYLSVVSGASARDSVLAAYSGGRTRIVARLNGRVEEQGRPAMRGRLVAFRRRFCGGWEVVTATVGGSVARAERRCTGQILGAPRRVRGGTAVSVRVRCRRGCAGVLAIAAPGHSESRRRATVRLSSRATRTFTLPLTRAAQRSRVRVRLALSQPPGLNRARTVDRASLARP